MIPFRENNCRANSKSQETIENDALSQEMVTQLKLEDTENINTLSMASNNTAQFHNINSHRSIVPLSYGDNPSFPAASKAIDLRDDCLKFSSSVQRQGVPAEEKLKSEEATIRGRYVVRFQIENIPIRFGFTNKIISLFQFNFAFQTVLY